MSIQVSELSKIYGKQKAVNQISFEVNSGEILGFLGPNGAGKSTTMKIITSYLAPTEGTVQVCGFDVQEKPMEVRRHIGYLPEHNPLYLDMYVKEYLHFIAELHGLRGSRRKSRLMEMIEICGLTREQKKKVGSLSKGYRQRVGLAQALIHDPPVLILDEPTTGLDPNQILEIRQLIKDIGQQKTVIFSTHIMQEVQAICDRVVIINLGEIVANSSVQELKALQKAENITMVEFAQDIDTQALAQVEGISRIEIVSDRKYKLFSATDVDLRAQVSQWANAHDYTLMGLQQEENTLEEVFQHLTKS